MTTHPAADRVTPDAMVVEQNRAVVPLSGWLVDAARTAAADGRLLQLLTLPDSALTYPLELLLADGAGQWIVRNGAGFRDGFTGAPMGWTGTRFAPVDGAVPGVTAVDLRRGGLDIQITTLHGSDAGLELGASTVAAMRALTGAAPAGFGVGEPATQPWSPRELTAACRERAPDPTALVVVGGPADALRPAGATSTQAQRRAVGRLHVSRVDAGVREELRLSGPVATAVADADLDALGAVLAGLATAPRSTIVRVHPTRVAGLRPPVPCPPALPCALLVGPGEVARRGIEHARRAPAASVRLLGDAAPSAWCRFPGDAPFAQLAAVLDHFGGAAGG